MRRYEFIHAGEVWKYPIMFLGKYVPSNCWYKVSRHYDRIVDGHVYVVCSMLYVGDQPEKFDKVQYARDEQGNKIGVFVAFDGKVGWSKVHPKDLKQGCINWRLGKELAASNSCSVWEFLLDRVPYRIRDQYQKFVRSYVEWLSNKGRSYKWERQTDGSVMKVYA